MTTETNPKTIYVCNEDDCGFQGPESELHEIEDIHHRVLTGEFMAAGQCPKCGALMEVDDKDIPDYTIEQAIVIARARGLLK